MKRNYLISLQFLSKYRIPIIFLLLLCLHIFFRFYLLFERANLGWDQTDSAWAANDILINKHFLINGPVVKGNSGFYMGPLYYYLISVFYFFTNLDPIASPIFAAFVSIVNSLVIFFITKKIFGTNVALVALFINTFSLFIMNSDRTQSAFMLIAPVSYVIFYYLYKVISGHAKYLPHLAVALGLSFHVDFTSVLYPVIIIFALPFFPWNKKNLRYIFLSILIFIFFISPVLFSYLQAKHSTSSNLYTYLHTFYHGLHLTRVLQLSHDAFYDLEKILQFAVFRPLVFLFLPIFMGIYYFAKPKKESLLLFYVMALWTIVPWLVLSTYSGEITDYYFSLPRNIDIAVLAFLTVFLFQRRLLLLKLIIVGFWTGYGLFGIQEFYKIHPGNLLGLEGSVKSAVEDKKIIPFKDKDPNSYLYYLYTRQKK